MSTNLGIGCDPTYRVVSRDALVEQLTLQCWPYEARDDSALARRRAKQTLDRWVDEGLPYSDSAGTRMFDPCEVTNFMKHVGVGSSDSVFAKDYVAGGRRSVQGFQVSGPARERGEQRAGVHSWRQFSLRISRELFTATMKRDRVRLRLPAPFEDDTQRNVNVKVDAPVGAQVRVGPARTEVSMTLPAQRPEVVRISAEYQFEAAQQTAEAVDRAGSAFALSDDDRALWTQPQEGWVRVTEWVRELAARVMGEAASEWAAVGAAYDFTLGLRSGAVHHGALDRAEPGRGIVESGWCDCATGSALLVALCRARGIPARVITGYSLYPIAPSYHEWLEVFDAELGWVPIDLGGWDLAAGDCADVRWARYFFAHLDWRLKTQCLPRLFTGSPGATVSRDWYLTQWPTDDGCAIAIHDLDSGRPVYSDRVSVNAGPLLPTTVSGGSPKPKGASPSRI